MRHPDGSLRPAPRQRAPVLFALLAASSLLLVLFLPRLAAAQPTAGPAGDGGLEIVEEDDSSTYLQFESGVSFISELVYEGSHPDTVGYGVRGGYRFGDWELALQLEHNFWTNDELDEGATSVLNAGILGGYTYFDGRVRSSLALGSSTLLFGTELVDAGHTGVFTEIRPVGIRIPIGEALVFEIHPMNFLIMAPVLDGLPLTEIAYRTTLAVDWTL